MATKFSIVGMAAGLALAGASAASADVIDFTTDSSATTGSVLGGIGWTATFNPDAFNNTQAYDGGAEPTNSFDLAFEKDGWGVTDDEISTSSQRQSITITFNSAVNAVGFAFLDLFEQGTSGDGEVGIMTVGGTSVSLGFDASNSASGGYAETLLANPLTGTAFTFTVGSTNDDAGFADGALAALEVAPVAPVPLPAAGLLLLGGLGGLAAMRRRKKAA